MSDAIKEISKACQTLEAKELAPAIAGIKHIPSLILLLFNQFWLFVLCPAVTSLRTLQAEITKIYIARLCSWMQGSTNGISKEEIWVPVSILERNKSPYAISYLPLAFHSIVKSVMDQISLYVSRAFYYISSVCLLIVILMSLCVTHLSTTFSIT